MTKSNKKKTVTLYDRRKKKDGLAKILTLFNCLAWIMILLVLITTECAKPQFETFFDRFYGLHLRTYWDIDFLQYLMWVSIFGILMSFLGIMLNFNRARRKRDSSILHISVMGIVSLAALMGAIYWMAHQS